jgi:hypothetical protein
MTEAHIKCDGKAICDATLTFSVLAFPNPEMEKRMRATAASINFPTKAPADG